MVLKTVKSTTVMRWRKCAACGQTWLTEEALMRPVFAREESPKQTAPKSPAEKPWKVAIAGDQKGEK
ncbi:MAG: hypothetical protein LBO72_04590 [Helicobacteraceae bacterium]|nr:hypothetical protein [Helicobacteraceae bacterium]